MKRIATILLVILVTANMMAAYTQSGIAYLYDYKTKKKTPLAGVSINCNGAQPAVSQAGGAFKLQFSTLSLGQKISFSKQPAYQGLTVFNKKVVDNWYIVQGRLELVMCKYDEFKLVKDQYYKLGQASIEKKYKPQIAQLAKEVQQIRKDVQGNTAKMKLYYEKCQKLQELNEEYERIMDGLRNSADAMARIDQSELDAEMQQVLDLYESGEVDAAMEKLEALDLKGKFEQTINVKQYHEQEAAAAAQDSAKIVAQIRASIDLYKNNGDYAKAADCLKLLADKLNTWDDLFDYANFCREQNDFNEAEEYYTKALNIIKPLAEANQAYEPDLAMTLNNLGILYYSTQRFNESEQAYKQALEIKKRLAEANPLAYEPSLAMTLNNLGLLYKDTHSFKESEQTLTQALKIDTRLAEANPLVYEPYLAGTLHNLGYLYFDTHRFNESEQAYKQALEIKKRLAEANQAYEPDLAMTLNNLGILYRGTHRYEESEQAYTQALEIRKRLANANPQAYEPNLAQTLYNLGNLYNSTQRFSESEQAYTQALEIRKRLAKANPQAYEPDLAMTLHNLGALYYSTQRYEESEQAYTQTLEIYKRLANANPQAYEPDLAGTLKNLGILYYSTQRFSESENVHKQALEIYKPIAKATPQTYEPDWAMTLYNLGLLMIEKEQYADAIQSFEEVLGIYRKLARGNSSQQKWLAGSLYYLSTLYGKTNNRTRDYEIRQELLPLLKDMYEADAENVRNTYATTIGGQSFNAIFMKKYSEAEQLAREGLEVDSTQHWIASNLAAALLLQGRYAEAEQVYRQYKDELKDSFLDDFEQFKAAGVIPKEREEDVAKIKRMLEE